MPDERTSGSTDPRPEVATNLERRRDSALHFARVLRDTTNVFDRWNRDLTDEWRDHRINLVAFIAWLEQVAEEAGHVR